MAIKQFNVGVKAVIRKDDTFLVLKHSTKHFWDWPGGRIDDNESIEEALRREISEELPSSKDVKIGNIIYAYRKQDVTFPDGSGLLLVMYRVELNFENDDVTLSDEHSQAQWLTRQEIEKLGSELLTITLQHIDIK